MATRFYFSSTKTVPYVIGPAGPWARIAEFDRYMMYVVKDGSAMTTKTIWANGAAAADESAAARGYFSMPMAPGVVFSSADTAKCYVRCAESALNDNINRQPCHLAIYRLGAAGLYESAVIFKDGFFGPNTTEWNTSLRNKTVLDGDTLGSNYTTIGGELLLLELGGQVSAAAGASVTGSMSFGSNSATDLGENETDTAANNPWLELSTNIAFLSPPIVVPQARHRAGSY